jgi:hypothetical protein
MVNQKKQLKSEPATQQKTDPKGHGHRQLERIIIEARENRKRTLTPYQSSNMDRPTTL